MVIALWKYTSNELPKSKFLYHRLLAVYFEQYLHTGGIVTANKEVQHVIDTINDGTLYLRGAHMSTLKGRAQIRRYTADQGVAFPDWSLEY